MTRTIAAVAAAALLLAASAPALARDDATLKAAAGAYVRHPVVQEMIDGMWSSETMRSAVVAQMRAHGKTLSDDQVDTLTRIVREELARVRPQFETLMENAVFETYSLGEIRALNRFIDTELGARAMAKSGAMMQSFNAAAAPMMRGMFKRMVARIKAEFRE